MISAACRLEGKASRKPAPAKEGTTQMLAIVRKEPGEPGSDEDAGADQSVQRVTAHDDKLREVSAQFSLQVLSCIDCFCIDSTSNFANAMKLLLAPFKDWPIGWARIFEFQTLVSSTDAVKRAWKQFPTSLLSSRNYTPLRARLEQLKHPVRTMRRLLMMMLMTKKP